MMIFMNVLGLDPTNVYAKLEIDYKYYLSHKRYFLYEAKPSKTKELY